MKKILPIIFILFSALAFSQTYKQKLAKETCECMNKTDVSGKNKRQLESALGLCLIKSSIPYSKEINKDYGINLETDIGNDSKMGSLGEQLGMVIFMECPDMLSKFSTEETSSNSDDKEESSRLINGTISKIEKDNFIVFHLVGDNKILNKFYWISAIESDIDLPKDYNSVLNKKVTISYYTSEIFDAKISDYRNLNIISSLRLD